MTKLCNYKIIDNGILIPKEEIKRIVDELSKIVNNPKEDYFIAVEALGKVHVWQDLLNRIPNLPKGDEK